jgi:hypothetical protein
MGRPEAVNIPKLSLTTCYVCTYKRFQERTFAQAGRDLAIRPRRQGSAERSFGLAEILTPCRSSGPALFVESECFLCDLERMQEGEVAGMFWVCGSERGCRCQEPWGGVGTPVRVGDADWTRWNNLYGHNEYAGSVESSLHVAFTRISALSRRLSSTSHEGQEACIDYSSHTSRRSDD